MLENKANYGWTGDFYKQAQAVVNCLGGGANAYNLILETAAAETGLATIPDLTKGAGMGVCQFDKKPFNWIKRESIKYREKILNELKVDISLVEWEHLRYNTFLSLIFCRLHYIRMTGKAIPSTFSARAKYWKKYYNSVKGKGTPEHYLTMSNRYLDRSYEFAS